MIVIGGVNVIVFTVLGVVMILTGILLLFAFPFSFQYIIKNEWVLKHKQLEKFLRYAYDNPLVTGGICLLLMLVGYSMMGGDISDLSTGGDSSWSDLSETEKNNIRYSHELYEYIHEND